MMMVVMAAATAVRVLGNVAMGLMARLTLCLQLQGGVTDAVFFQFGTHRFLNLVRIFICYNVHGSVVVLSVHTPNVNMMNIQNTGDFFHMGTDFAYINISRSAF